MRLRYCLFGLGLLLLPSIASKAFAVPRRRAALLPRAAPHAAVTLESPDALGSGHLGERTYEFSLEDGQALQWPGHRTGVVYVPEGVDPNESDSVPLVLFLHGTNETGTLHLWFRQDGPRADLRPLADALIRDGRVAPFVIAAPSYSTAASGAGSLWHNFSLPDFLDQAEGVLPDGLHVDRSRIILVGHSGAGCNPQGGLLHVASDPALSVRPFAIVAIDTCLTEEGARMLAQTDPATHVIVYWQTRTWPRAFETFRSQFRRSSQDPSPLGLRLIEAISVLGSNPHNDIVNEAMARSLRRLLPR